MVRPNWDEYFKEISLVTSKSSCGIKCRMRISKR